ncbi:YdeI/OmpD-associated family protein [Flavisolibacter ginsenosidimutans]|uniref:DUF1905 domain-containing protein n=1 Tax=Flavisolibacter ginsenosidimutans TaxID=661481 RepID=A0A5B8UNV9_9BACT|nr:YdeI/OmpD-associated family protein [Flavisolibacter ginsenosidimutans]QEC58288.1 DUF1905 domain-containing protein [Flavisolibacter ginsenosidimutans]
MLRFITVLKKFDKQGEKTGWTYIEISAKQAAQLNPGVKTSYRVKGRIDDYVVEKMALIPMGEGVFIMPLNATIRKGIKKQKGAEVEVWLELDTEPIQVNADFMECLRDEPAALKTFDALPKGHQNYFSKWIESAKTEPTKAKRIALAVNALSKGWGFPEMLRAQKKEKQQFGL